METLAFNEFPTRRVIESEWYGESDKQLSFVYREERQKSDDGLRAFIAMKQENAPIQLEGKGCKIMGYYVRKENDKRLVYSDLPILRDKLFEEAIDSITMWSHNGETVFDYYWFELSELMLPLCDFIDNLQIQDNIAYFILER